MSAILGINAFHADSSACLLLDGVLHGAVAEERLGERKKHDPSFPLHSIDYLLADAGITLQDITHVAVARDTAANKMQKMKYVARNPVESAGAVYEHFRRKGKTDDVLGRIAGLYDVDPGVQQAEVVYVEHHLAHIASAYFLSPHEGLTAGFSYDASGDFVSMMAARCEGARIEITDKVYLPDSLGFFYTALCQFIGFDRFGEEYKVMGLAPYGEDNYRELMQELVTLELDWYGLSRDYFSMHSGGESGKTDDSGEIIMGKLYTERLIKRLGAPRNRDAGLEQVHKDIARSTQVRFEEAAVHCLRSLHSMMPTERLAMAGGCALNGVANARILRETEFSRPYLQAAASDDGTSLGAAYYCWHQVLGNEARFEMRHAFWGPSYSEERYRSVVRGCNYSVFECKSEAQLVDNVAQLLGQGMVTGWYQGRSEWGPRALGNRSILADPSNPEMKDIINRKIKKRESFRPFAPSVMKEYVGEYFEQEVDSPFMMHVVKFRQKWEGRLPAVTHVDGTGRVQTVGRDNNPLYYELINAFRKLTGLAMLLNTSFNENEPVVDTPEQAMSCFERTDMDVLCLGRFIIAKNQNYLRYF